MMLLLVIISKIRKKIDATGVCFFAVQVRAVLRRFVNIKESRGI